MPNEQLLLAIGIPAMMILIGIILQQVGTGRVEARLTVIEADLRRFYQILGEHTGQIDILKGKQQ